MDFYLAHRAESKFLREKSVVKIKMIYYVTAKFLSRPLGPSDIKDRRVLFIAVRHQQVHCLFPFLLLRPLFFQGRVLVFFRMLC